MSSPGSSGPGSSAVSVGASFARRAGSVLKKTDGESPPPECEACSSEDANDCVSSPEPPVPRCVSCS